MDIQYSNNFVATVANKECLLTKLPGNIFFTQSKNVSLQILEYLNIELHFIHRY